MWNQSWGTYEEHQILKILLRWSWKNVKINMDIKADVLSKKFQDWWRFSKIDGEVCHESFEANILSEDMMKMISNPNG